MAGDVAFGTILSMGTPAVAIANVTDMSGPSYSAETIDMTAHDSASYPYREFSASFIDAGEMSFDINFDPDGVTHKNVDGGLLYAMENQVEEDWEIAFPDGTEVAFEGPVIGFEIKAPMDDKLSASVKIKISGKPTWTYAA